MLGLLRDGNGKAIDILNALDVDLSHLRRKVEILSPSNPNIMIASDEKKNLHLTRQAERALKTTFLEAKLFQSKSINTAHLLLCVLRNENDPTTKLLNKLKVDYDNAKEQFKYMITNDDDTRRLQKQPLFQVKICLKMKIKTVHLVKAAFKKE